jgi:hypothetical protein
MFEKLMLDWMKNTTEILEALAAKVNGLESRINSPMFGPGIEDPED